MLRTSREVQDLNELANVHPRTNLRVFVVDDNIDAATMTATVVQRWGHTVMMAHSSAEAEQVFGTFQPHVVLLDLGLPDRHGYDLAESLKARSVRKVHFVAVTGWNQIADQIRSNAAGIAHHLMKPPNLEVLREILAAYVQVVEPPISPES